MVLEKGFNGVYAPFMVKSQFTNSLGCSFKATTQHENLKLPLPNYQSDQTKKIFEGAN